MLRQVGIALGNQALTRWASTGRNTGRLTVRRAGRTFSCFRGFTLWRAPRLAISSDQERQDSSPEPPAALLRRSRDRAESAGGDQSATFAATHKTVSPVSSLTHNEPACACCSRLCAPIGRGLSRGIYRAVSSNCSPVVPHNSEAPGGTSHNQPIPFPLTVCKRESLQLFTQVHQAIVSARESQP